VSRNLCSDIHDSLALGMIYVNIVLYLKQIIRSQAWISIVSAGSFLVWKLEIPGDKLCHVDSTVVLAIDSDSLLCLLVYDLPPKERNASIFYYDVLIRHDAP
jgi:hypothetical protein